MPIRFQCEDCQSRIKVPDGAEGRKVKCPRCGAVHPVPHPQMVPAAPEPVQEQYDPPPAPDKDTAFDPLASLAGAAIQDDIPSFPAPESDPQPVPESFFPDDPAAAPSDQFQDDLLPQVPQESDDEADDEADPLSALAAMSEAPDQEPVDPFDGEPPPRQQTGLALEPPEPEPHYPLQALASAPMPKPAAMKQVVPVARPKPKPQPIAKPPTAPKPPTQSKPRSPEPSPRVVPSPSPAVRAVAQAIPVMGEPVTAVPRRRRLAAKKPSTLLTCLGWALRVLAFCTVGGAVKLVLVASDLKWPMGEQVFVLLAGLTAAVVVWTVGEIALVVRKLPSR